MTHPEEYLSSRYTDKYVPHDIIKEYAISNTIHLWINYFLSLGIELLKEDKENSEFKYTVTIKYIGNGFYELRFFLDKEQVDGKWKTKQNIPFHIQSEVEEIIITDDRNFIDCDMFTGEIYVSFNYEEYFMNYERKNMISQLLNKIRNNIEVS